MATALIAQPVSRARRALRWVCLLALAATCSACGGAEGLVDEEPLKPQRQVKGVILFPVAVMTPEADSIAIAHRKSHRTALASQSTRDIN